MKLMSYLHVFIIQLIFTVEGNRVSAGISNVVFMMNLIQIGEKYGGPKIPKT